MGPAAGPVPEQHSREGRQQCRLGNEQRGEGLRRSRAGHPRRATARGCQDVGRTTTVRATATVRTVRVIRSSRVVSGPVDQRGRQSRTTQAASTARWSRPARSYRSRRLCGSGREQSAGSASRTPPRRESSAADPPVARRPTTNPAEPMLGDLVAGARNASNTSRAVAGPPDHAMAAAGTTADTARRQADRLATDQDNQMRPARQRDEFMHFHATGPRDAGEGEHIQRGERQRQHPAQRLDRRLRPGFAGRIQIATLTSMNGSRNTSDKVRTTVPEGRSPQRYASSVTLFATRARPVGTGPVRNRHTVPRDLRPPPGRGPGQCLHRSPMHPQFHDVAGGLRLADRADASDIGPRGVPAARCRRSSRGPAPPPAWQTGVSSRTRPIAPATSAVRGPLAALPELWVAYPVGLLPAICLR